MILDFLIATFAIGFVVFFVLLTLNLARLKKERKILNQKRKERNERFATFDQHFANGDFFVKDYHADDDIFASIEEEI